MPLTKDDLVVRLTSLSPINNTIQEFAINFANAYLVYASSCQTGLPMSLAPTGVNAASLDPTRISSLISALTNDSTADDFATALSDGINAFWAGATFNVPSTITGAVVVPPIKLVATLDSNNGAQTVELKDTIITKFLNSQTDTADGFAAQMKRLAPILHGCTRSGVTAGVNMTNPLTPINFVGILGDPSDIDPIDLT